MPFLFRRTTRFTTRAAFSAAKIFPFTDAMRYHDVFEGGDGLQPCKTNGFRAPNRFFASSELPSRLVFSGRDFGASGDGIDEVEEMVRMEEGSEERR